MAVRQGVQKVPRGGAEWWQHAMNRMLCCPTTPSLLDLAYDAIRGGLGYDRVAVFLVDPTRRVLVERIATNESGRKVYPRDHAISLDGGFYDCLLTDPRLQVEGPGFLYQSDTAYEAPRHVDAQLPAAEPEWAADQPPHAAREQPDDRPPMTLYVALRTPTAVLGLLSVGQYKGETPSDTAPLVAFATALATSIERASLLDERSRWDADEPAALRRRIAELEQALRRQHEEQARPREREAYDESIRPGLDESVRPGLDAVTGLLNPQALLADLDRAIAAGEPFALLLLDIDNFRLFNDTHGYASGNQVLGKVALALCDACGAADVVGRYGNDEFAILLHGAAGPQARLASRRLEGVVRAHAHITADGVTIPHSVSSGLACYPSEGSTREALIALAEESLALAKGGRRTARRTPHAHLLEDSHVRVLNGLVTAVDSKDRYTREHSDDMTRWALLLAETLGLDVEQRRALALAGPLHDIGKIAVPDRILRKPGKLTREEYEIMKHHVPFGVAIIQGVLHDDAVIEAVAHHHERWDGQGYPHCLARTGVPLLGRIMQVADAVSAMRQNRPYRQGLPWVQIVAQLRACAGTQFDPDLVEPFIAAVGRVRGAAQFRTPAAVPASAPARPAR